jgi:hypothetical protein
MYKKGRIAQEQEPMNNEQGTPPDEAEGGSPVRSQVGEPAICDEREWRRF